ncbi:hypothetical protein [Calothrix sp. PCC 7507]|uniref:hypothetical protein n=1 Tax=Calothrix sp. PCC 7507 TaxID=99598 RepID=UPI00029F3EA2|nr:hypothetical protein [Calothrix sp. PCC 7507]AFY34546.1 hypothetical protein Cal7507_4167 [Calothrix sp. PCC 7507]
MDAILERSHALKQALVDFVLDAEGELAQALESYAAEHLRRSGGDSTQRNLITNSFITEGKVGDKSPLELFIASHPDLSESDRHLLTNWERSFIGLFAITEILPDGVELMNWLTAKHYIAKPNNSQTLQEISRLKVGEILLTSISPITDSYWLFSDTYTIMGKLGKPKLAVAIGNFKDNYKSYLYRDAPELLAEAWHSVEQYHHQFVDFFGSDEITLPGYQLNKKIAEFQEILLQKSLEAAGIDPTKSLAEVAAAAGLGEEEINAVAQEAGADSEEVAQIFKNKSKMVAPKVDLPGELKKAEQVTALSHPRWGQIFLPTYSKIKTILSAEDWQSVEGGEKLIRYYLEDNSINAFIWERLAQEYPTSLEKVLQTYLKRPELSLTSDLDALLQEFHKPLKPELPEIASVPIHLHNLFQEALGEVNKSKPKNKGQKNPAKGFK